MNPFTTVKPRDFGPIQLSIFKSRCVYLTLTCLSLITTVCPLNAEKIVHCIANFQVDPDVYTRALKRHGYDGKVIVVDVKDYESKLLKKKGHWLHKLHLDFFNKVDVPEDVDKIIFFNLSPKVTLKYDLSRLPKEKLVLFMWEPRTVLRRMYRSKVHDWFSQIYTWDDSLVDNRTYFKFNYPVLSPMIDEIPSFEQKKFCTLVASNLKSKDKNELYSQRKEVIRFFEGIGEEGFEFYGKKWEASEYTSYRGTVPDKIATIKNYRFSICYENTHGTPGYVTEKIFDCFSAGNVPVYWGASNAEDYIPKDCFIDRRDFSSMDELYVFLKGMRKETYEGYLTRIKAFLKSDAAAKFTQRQLEETFCRAVMGEVTLKN